jgi:predicted RNase H-like HicB family nuclease
MSIAEMREGCKSSGTDTVTAWRRFAAQRAFECPVLLCPECEAGGFSVHALTLPGAVSQGETGQEALDNIREAIEGLVLEYRETGTAIPWQHVVVDDVPTDATTRWILVNV